MGKNNRERRKEKKRADLKRQREREKEATTQRKRDRLQRKYLSEWSISAQHIERGGHYQWMLSHVVGQTSLLEVGTGDGRSTLQLAKAGHAVVAVEENPACLQATSDRLEAAGILHKVVRRAQITANDAMEVFEASYESVDAEKPSAGAVLLLEGDIANDPGLAAWLRGVSPFDAITCWLLGTHGAQRRNLFYGNLHLASEYRLAVQNSVYELAEQILRPGGVLSIIDRGLLSRGPRETTDLQDHHAGHVDQARLTRLQVGQPQVRPYQESDDEKRMKLIAQTASPEEAEQLAKKDMVLLSVSSAKPNCLP